jgi:hypothetical protein
MEYIYIDLEGIAYYKPRLHGIYIYAYIFFSIAKQHKIKSSTRENRTIRRYDELETYEVTSSTKSIVLE